MKSRFEAFMDIAFIFVAVLMAVMFIGATVILNIDNANQLTQVRKASAVHEKRLEAIEKQLAAAPANLDFVGGEH